MSAVSTLRRYLVLPEAISDFERGYLARMNRIAFIFFVAHVPLMTLLAFFNDTDPLLAVVTSSVVLAGPLLLRAAAPDRPRLMSMMFGFVAMLMGGLFVHFGSGPVQIEMHFYFFCLIAMCAVFANPMVIVVAAATVAVHHLVLWAVIPKSVFNYDAPIWVVLVHAGFVVLESVASVFIARSFFDNVIGLEKIVAVRTAELVQRNQEMKLVLENVEQGVVVCDSALRLGEERSAPLGRWFKGTGDTFVDVVAAADASFAATLGAAWEQVRDGFLPLDVALGQLPSEIHLDDGLVLRSRFIPIGTSEMPERFLLVVSDETASRQQMRLEAEARDTVHAFEHVVRDRSGFVEFLEEGAEIVEALARHTDHLAVDQRLLHTLKGNALIFGIESLATLCEEVETRLVADTTSGMNEAERQAIVARFSRLRENLAPVLNDGADGSATADDIAELLSAVRAGTTAPEIERIIASFRDERLSRRFARVAEQARRLGDRLDRGNIVVEIDDAGVRLDARSFAPFWSAFIHVIRNAVDHGLEPRGERTKSAPPTLTLRSRQTSKQVVVEVRDNGRGIDWARVAARARARGLPHETRSDLIDALFVDGLSTRDAATEFSGRGVGLSAVRDACVGLGGSVAVDSDVNGTCFRFTFPSRSGTAAKEVSAWA